MNGRWSWLRTALFAAGAAAAVQTSGVASASPAHTWRASLDGSPGWIERTYALSDVNRCVENTSGNFGSDRIAGQVGLGVVHSYKRYRVKGNDCLSLQGGQPQQHVEGMARIPVAGREMLYFSYMDSGIGVNSTSIVRVDVRASQALTGEQFLVAQTDDRTSELMFCKKLGNAPHVGGLQAIGDFLFAGVEDSVASTARVDIFQVKDGNVMRANSAITINTVRMPEGSLAHYVLATRLADGKYLMAVNRNNAGKFSLFWADHPMGQWQHAGDQTFPLLGSWSSEGERYQSANFVTDCAGKLYIVGLGQTLAGNGWTGNNEVFAYAVDLRRYADNRPYIAGLSDAGFFAMGRAENRCEMRGAGGVHVTPSGRLSLYCGPRHEVEWLGHDFEFASIRPPE